MPIGRGRSGGGVRLRPVSSMRGEGGSVVPRGAGASGALVMVLEASGCGRRAMVCLARFILRHAVAATRRASNCWIVSSLQKYRVGMDGRAIWRLPGSSRSLRSSGEKPFFDGIWDEQPKSLSPNGAILGDMARKSELGRSVVASCW